MDFRRSLNGYFRKYVWKRVVLKQRSLTILTATWIAFAAALEVLSHQPTGLLRDWASTILAVLEGLALAFVLAALLRQLLDIINGQRGASLKDLGSIGYAYLFVIFAFASIYLATDNFAGASFLHNNRSQTPFRLFDHLYLSGITIATVGYGDIVPVTWPTKMLVVVEAVTGLWLTVTVLGVFIGSLLSRQLQDKQSKFFRDFQRDYLRALTTCQTTINSISELSEEEQEEFRRSILATIAHLVRLQYEPLPSAIVRANWMRFYESGVVSEPALLLARQFVVPQFGTVETMPELWGILVLQDWDERPVTMPGKEELVLPVYFPQTLPQLPGAPQAMTTTEGYVIVSDVSKIDLGTQDEDVRGRLAGYFRERAQDIRSFASVRIGNQDKPFGVINIQSDDLDLCGTSPEVQQLLVDMIRPFATYLRLVGLQSENNLETNDSSESGAERHPVEG